MPLFVLVLVRNEGAVVRDVFVDGAREKTVEGAREGAVVAVVCAEMRRVRLMNCCCCWVVAYAHSEEGALLLTFEDEDAFESIESFFLRDVVGLEDDLVLRRTDLEKRVMNFAPPPLVLRFE